MSRWRRILGRTLLGVAVALGLVLVVVRVVYGGGEPYPDLSTAPALADDQVEVLAGLEQPPGNITAAADGRIFFNTHPFVVASRFSDTFVFELVDGQPQPYPDVATQPDLANVFGMNVDAQQRLWLISPASLERERTRLQAFDLRTNERVVDHEFEPGIARFSQDLRILPDGKTAIFADTGAFRFTDASIIIVDLETFETRSVLVDHSSTRPQDWFIQTADGPHTVGWGLVTFAVGVDGIALSPDGRTLYYAAMSHDTLYRIETAALLDDSLSPEVLASRVEAVGPKPLSDGITVGADGTVFITDIEHGGVATMSPEGQLRTLMKRGDVIWADGVALAPNGDVLLTDSAIPHYLDPLLLPPSRSRLEEGRPYRLFRFAPSP